MQRIIRKIAVLGSGIMGSRIACHFANIGLQVWLLDRVPSSLSLQEEKKGLRLNDAMVRNRIVRESLENTLKSQPSPVYTSHVASRIHLGNFEDDLAQIQSCDWVIEAVIEDLSIKRQLYESVEPYRKMGTLISTNTSGIPIGQLVEGRSEDFKSHFCGTHFFNPPRYLPLLELIPGPQTKPDVIEFLEQYAAKWLGKTAIVCKDTPAFIGNRIGIYSMLAAAHLVDIMGLTIEETDKYTGPVIGHPKSATFRTADVVGLDTLSKVAQGIYQEVPQDEARALFLLPTYVQTLLDKGALGEKTKEGFYKKVKNPDGSSEIQVLDIHTGSYRSQKKFQSATLQSIKELTDLKQRVRVMTQGQDHAGRFFNAFHYGLFEYVSHRVPEITDSFYRIDEAMRAGFGWELGPFELWDALGVQQTVAAMQKAEKLLPGQNGKVAPWILEMLEAGFSHFYKNEDGQRWAYDPLTRSYQPMKGMRPPVVLSLLSETQIVWKNAGVTLCDLGDGILNIAFHSKMNSIGGEVLAGIHKGLDLAESTYRGVVITNDGALFSAGANIGLLFMLALEQEYDELHLAVHQFQQTSMRIKYASVPVVVAPFQMTLGGGCEFSMHADFVQMHAETYLGLVEVGVGLIPAGGGTKEMAARISDDWKEGQIAQQILRQHFMTIAQGKVSTSAFEAIELGYLVPGQTAITMHRDWLLHDAKAKAIALADAGYTPAVPRQDIRVLGKQGLGIIYAGANSMKEGKFISAHDQKIAEKLGWVLCGGDLSSPTEVSEQYLLDLEREAFLSLAGERKTVERLQYMLTKGKALRN
jgi:3-hydroxyacyl-CoA dehydrogenase